MDQLSTVDSSFLRVETPSAHMHVAWCALCEAPAEGTPRPDIERLRSAIEGRLDTMPRFRRRLRFAPPGMGEPFWVDDENFDIARHVNLLCDPDDRPDERRFHALVDRVLSEPLDRTRPLWRVYLVPQLADGRVGIAAKIHHALVDGKSAVEVALLMFDVTPDADPAPAAAWRPEPEPGTARLALGALSGGAAESLRAARGVARMAGAPRVGGARIYDSVRAAAMTVGDDVLRPAPASFLNVPIGPRRTLVGHHVPVEGVLAIKRATGVTLNDVVLATVAGALREQALARGETPRPLKTMVPVSRREESERTALGNRISFAFVELPLQLGSPGARLAAVHNAMTRAKTSGKIGAVEDLYVAISMLPSPARTPIARLAGSKHLFNLTVSNIPGPRFPLYVLGAKLEVAYPVVPLAPDHALAIGVFSYCDRLGFGFYADPEALPDVGELPDRFDEALAGLARVHKRGRKPLPKRYVSELLSPTTPV